MATTEKQFLTALGEAAKIALIKSKIIVGGPTTGRPASPLLNETYFDTDLMHQVVFDGSNWVQNKGADGTDGKGFTGGTYTPATGVVEFTSADGLGFSTGDLRGADGADVPNPTGGDGLYMRMMAGVVASWHKITDTFTLKGDNPHMSMRIDPTGSSAQMSVIDESTSHQVASFEYHKASNSMLLTISDPASGTMRGQWQFDNDGSVKALMAHTALPTDPDSKDLVTAQQIDNVTVDFTAALQSKADKSELVGVYFGDTVPPDTFGRDRDRFHLYQSDTVTQIESGTAENDFANTGFTLFYGPNDIYDIYILPSSREVWVYYAKGVTLSINQPSIVFDVEGTVDLTITHQDAGGFSATYDATADSVIAAITKGATFTFYAHTMTISETDYYKYNGRWIERPIFPFVFKHNTISDHVITAEDDYTGMVAGGGELVNQLDNPALESGIYTISFATTYHSQERTKSAIFSWSIDGGTTWEVFQEESKDGTDRKISYYKFPITHGGGDLNIITHAARETGYDIAKEFDILYQTITLERVK